MNPQAELFVKMVLLSWETQNNRTGKLFDSLSDEQLLSQVSPGRNRGIYLLGHLTAVNDSLAVILGLGDRLFPQYENIFIKTPDKSSNDLPAIPTLRESWNQVTQKLKDAFKKMSAEDWFRKHASILEEDFANEPHRNKLNVLITRVTHEAYHHGQLALLQKKVM